MSGPIESADELLIRVSDGYAIEQRIGELCRAIEARDNAVRLALLDELRDSACSNGWVAYWADAMTELYAKYGAKP